MGVQRIFKAALAGVALAAAPIAATTATAQVYDRTNVETMVEAINSIGGFQAEAISMFGQPSIGVRTARGAAIVLQPRACNEGKCVGLSFMGLFGTSVGAERANAFNQGPVVAKLASFNDRSILFHYVIADYGIDRGNLAVNLLVMEAAIGAFQEFISQGQGVEVSFAPLLPEDTVNDDHGQSAFVDNGLPLAGDWLNQ